MPTTATKSYRYRITFRAPRPFVFRWCTDYSPTDPRLEGESYERRVLERSKGRVIYEDLEETSHGWSWARHVVTLRPPYHWHSDSVGNYRRYRLNYDLKDLGNGRTELEFEGRRSLSLLPGRHPTTRAFDASMERTWRRFRRELEREYRAQAKGRRSKTRAGRPSS